MFWHTSPLQKISQKLKTNFETGLTEEEAQKRRQNFGLNEIQEKKQNHKLKVFFDQFKSPLIYILIIAGSISLILKAYTDAGVIFGAVLMQVILGFAQEYKASKALAKLKKSIKVRTIVLRDGQKKEIDQSQLVAGDVGILRAGDKVPADGRIIDGDNLKINEAILTGEWLAVHKKNLIIKEETILSERENMLYMGTTVESGQGKFVVTSIAEKTEIGKIALNLSAKEEQTTLQKKTAKLSKVIGFFLAITVITIFLEGILKGKEFLVIFNISVATAVAAIPEGLIISLTVILALGMQRILKKKGLVKRLASAETLGSASVICTDKTGTLTQAKMETAGILTGEKELLKKNGSFFSEIDTKSSSAHALALKITLLSTSAFIENPNDAFKNWILRGTPTEKALLQAGISFNLDKQKIEKEEPQITELLFTPENKFAAKLRQFSNKENILYLTGAPEVILEKSIYIYVNNQEKKLFEENKKNLSIKYELLSKKGFRILAVGYKKIQKQKDELNQNIEDLCQEIVFVGFIALHDPLRPKTAISIALCQKAGIRPIIVTGDHKLTAKKIAEEIGMKIEAKNILEGKDLENLTDKEFEQKIKDIKIYARLNPYQKIRIVQAWQKQGEIVAMTGDGVNDALALKKADIGIALGSGTEIAKEAADLILLNDDFNVIVEGIKEGRAIVDNIRKVITYLLSDSFTEVILIGVSIILGLPLPLLPLHILWVNLIEDGLPSIALAFEKREKDVMQRKPEKNLNLLNTEMKVLIFLIGIITDVLLLGLFLGLIKYSSYSLTHIQSIIFACLTIDSLFFIFSCKSLRKNVWQVNPFSNQFLNFAWIFGIFALLLALYFPPLQNILKLCPLNFTDWQIVLGLGFLNFGLIEFTKWIFIRKLMR